MIKTDFTEGMVIFFFFLIFLKICFTGKLRKRMVCVIWVKNSIFMLRGFFHVFLSKGSSKEIKNRKEFERKENISFFSFFEGLFFMFFNYELLIL